MVRTPPRSVGPEILSPAYDGGVGLPSSPPPAKALWFLFPQAPLPVELYLRVTAGWPDRDGEDHLAGKVATVQAKVQVPGLDLETTVMAEVEIPDTRLAPRSLELPLVVLTNEGCGVDYPVVAFERDRHHIGFIGVGFEAIEDAERDPALNVEVISVRPASVSASIEPHVGLDDRKLILVVDSLTPVVPEPSAPRSSVTVTVTVKGSHWCPVYSWERWKFIPDSSSH